MQGFFALAVVCLSFFTTAFARVSDHHSRSNALSSRQYHVPRSLIDVCAALDLGAVVDLLPILGAGAKLDLCLCLSAFPLEIELYAGLGAVVDVLGIAEVEAILKLLINEGGHHCTYPANSHPICAVGKPCGFTCPPPYIEQNGECACPAPMHECNGKCVSNACSSAVPRSLNKQAVPKSLRDAQAVCGAKAVCGVPSKSKAYECVDTLTNLESCGGCMVPQPFGGPAKASGKDCSTISHNSEVACDSGSCVVSKCASGYKVASDNGSCVAA